MMDKERILAVIDSIQVDQMATAKRYDDGEITRQQYKNEQRVLNTQMDLAQRALRCWKHFNPEAKDQGKVRPELLGARNRDEFNTLLDRVETAFAPRLPSS